MDLYSMDMRILILKILIAVTAGYLLGSLSSSIILSKAKYLVDIRSKGSGNAGATNMARVHGLAAGLLTLGGDMLKTGLAGLLGWLLAGRLGLVIACGACLVGHCWPAYYRFQGGKGVSVAVCIALLLDWKLLLILAAVFVGLFMLYRRVSLSSVVCAAIYPLVYWLTGNPMDAGFVLCCAVTVIVIFAHRSNIRRLLRGEEPPFTLKRGG